jgi:hypothetical protein
MMNILKSIIGRQSQNITLDPHSVMSSNSVKLDRYAEKVHETRLESEHYMLFRVWPAVGGHVIEMRKNTHNSVLQSVPSNVPRLYLVPDGADLGHEISMIITRESLS